MNISDILLKTLTFCAQNKIDFQMVSGNEKKNDYVIDKENKKITITLIDPSDKEFLKLMKNNFDLKDG